MTDGIISKGFTGRRRNSDLDKRERIPPGQYETDQFPVLSAGPTPRVSLDRWTFKVSGKGIETLEWNWNEFQKLAQETFTVDIHCVTKWSKLDTVWKGVSLDTIFSKLDLISAPNLQYIVAKDVTGYTTNLPLKDVINGKAWVVHEFDGKTLSADHGGPARLLVPHLYLWKSVKWVNEIILTEKDQPGFWESVGYHNYGDPFLEQRYRGD